MSNATKGTIEWGRLDKKDYNCHWTKVVLWELGASIYKSWLLDQLPDHVVSFQCQHVEFWLSTLVCLDGEFIGPQVLKTITNKHNMSICSKLSGLSRFPYFPN